jgi:hypothetical protein
LTVRIAESAPDGFRVTGGPAASVAPALAEQEFGFARLLRAADLVLLCARCWPAILC